MKKINFTEKTIEEILPPTEKDREEYTDTQVDTLRLRVTKSGVKTFSFYRYVKVMGKQQRITIGKFPHVKLKEARQKARDYTSDAENGIDPSKPFHDLKTEPTFDEFFSIWLERYSKKQKKSWKDDEWRHDKYIKRKHFGKLKLSQITRAHVSNLHHAASKGLKGGGANRLLALVSVVFTYAIEWGYCERNPALGIRRFKEDSRDRFLTKDELPVFLKALEGMENKDARDFIKIALFTGARKSNLLAMRWDSLNADFTEWHIKETKNGTPQIIPLAEPAREILLARKNQSAWVFPSPLNPDKHMATPRTDWEKLLGELFKLAKIKDLRIHDLRRTLGSWMAITGTSLHIIGKSLNHKSAASTQVYARLSNDPVRNAQNVAIEAMLGQIKKD